LHSKIEKMAKHQDNDEIIVDVEEVYSKTEQYVEENKNTLTIVLLAVIAVVGLYFGYTNLYLAPLEEEAQAQMWQAEQYFEVDSFNLALNGNIQGAIGFKTIADHYSGTKAGNLANYYCGISYYNLGQYQDAINYLEAFSSDDKMVGPVATGAIGNCYMELSNPTEALAYYKKASNQSKNDFTGPMFRLKAGFAAEQLGQTDVALDLYKSIKTDFPTSQESRNVEKYIARLGEY
jgi:tetratricopeptide (TPR) repeat protein